MQWQRIGFRGLGAFLCNSIVIQWSFDGHSVVGPMESVPERRLFESRLQAV